MRYKTFVLSWSKVIVVSYPINFTGLWANSLKADDYQGVKIFLALTFSVKYPFFVQLADSLIFSLEAGCLFCSRM